MSATAPHASDASVINAVDRLLDLKLLDHADSGALHLFAAHEPPLQALRDIAQTAYSVSLALASHQTIALAEPKTISGLRQQSSDARTLHTNAAIAASTLEALKTRSHSLYGEDVPLDRNVLPWILRRLEQWGKAVGMEVFQEPPQSGELTCLMAGKVVVADIVFTVADSAPETSLKSLKLSYASPNESSASSPLFLPDENDPSESYSLDKFLFDTLGAFVDEVQKGDDIALPDASQAAKLGETFSDHLKYLMKLDTLASSTQSGEHSMHWLNGVHSVALLSWALSRIEAQLTRSLLTSSATPLDIFLARSHALPLPYLRGANISFLAHISPLAYMKVSRVPVDNSGTASIFDVPLLSLRRSIDTTSQANEGGYTWATLSLRPALFDPAYMQGFAISSRPSFDARLSLPPELQDNTHDFPVDPQSTFMLTIEGGGIVMAESRMHDIQQALGISLALAPDLYGNILPLQFGWASSWVDMLLNPTKGDRSESYLTIYRSPHSLHPPLRLRLKSPSEPGFVLSRVPVKSLQQVWAVLEIVREQAWINELLHSCDWIPDMIDTGMPEFANYGDQSLDALLTGTYVADTLPVHISIPPPAPPVLGADMTNVYSSRPTLRMVVPVPKRPGEALMPRTSVVTLCTDPSRPRGVRVEVDGVLVESLDESVRRGGALGIGGRLWAGLVNG